MNNHDALMTGDGPSLLATAEPVARPQEWQVQPSGSQEAQRYKSQMCSYDRRGPHGQGGASTWSSSKPLWLTVPSPQAAH